MPGRTNGDQPNDDKPKNIFERVKKAYKKRQERKARERQRRERQRIEAARRISGSRENIEWRQQQRREERERRLAAQIERIVSNVRVLDPREPVVEARLAERQPEDLKPGKLYRSRENGYDPYVKAQYVEEVNNTSQKDLDTSNTKEISKEKLTNLTEQPKEKAEKSEKAKAREQDKNNRNSQDSTRSNKSKKRKSQGRNI
ncbi:hypothetical protein [uncultured Aquimarina sp.]|uniref:hypothetical protein n=1 Tax=uncultured Aquimarina sp. TaxID=575652 RepID=UPI0026339D64|nr:hypothetical protein [uncultured Aquimarina sp.]